MKKIILALLLVGCCPNLYKFKDRKSVDKYLSDFYLCDHGSVKIAKCANTPVNIEVVIEENRGYVNKWFIGDTLLFSEADSKTRHCEQGIRPCNEVILESEWCE